MPDARVFSLAEFGQDLLTRDQGKPVFRSLEERVGMLPCGAHLTVSFEGVQAIAPSFVDECLGRFLLKHGKTKFREVLRLDASDETVRRLVNRVLLHRTRPAEEVPQ